MGNIRKLFFEEKTSTYATSLKEAKKAGDGRNVCPYVYRVWVQEGMVIGRELVYAYKESCCKVRRADEIIYERVKGMFVD